MRFVFLQPPSVQAADGQGCGIIACSRQWPHGKKVFSISAVIPCNAHPAKATVAAL